MQTTARKLTSWSAKSVGNVRDKLAISRELLLRFDGAQEQRQLTPHEDWLRRQIKLSYLGLLPWRELLLGSVHALPSSKTAMQTPPFSTSSVPTGGRKT
jgi:hypothetical protein